MRRLVAVIIDVVSVTAIGYAGFRIGSALSGCSNLGDCTQLTPLVVGLVVLGVAGYFGAGYLTVHSTFGERIARVSTS